MNLKIGGNSVGKIMYNGQEFGGATKLEPGTILYMSEKGGKDFKSVHLLSTTKNWNNLNSINVASYNSSFSGKIVDLDISNNDFKSLDIEKEYTSFSGTITVSRSIVDGEYRLNVSAENYLYHLIIKAL